MYQPMMKSIHASYVFQCSRLRAKGRYLDSVIFSISLSGSHLQDPFLLALLLLCVSCESGVAVFTHFVHLVPIILQRRLILRTLPADNLKQTGHMT